MKLFLRPSGEPQQIWYKSTTYRGQDEFTETVDRLRNLGPDEVDAAWWMDPPLPMTKLCSLLQRMCDGPDGWFHLPGPGPAVIVAEFDDLERFGDMIPTDPPSYRASCSLYYRRMVRPACWVHGDRSVRSKSPLTIRKLLDRAFRQQNHTTTQFVDPDTGKATRGTATCSSFQKVIAGQRRRRGGHFELVPNLCMIHFADFNFASCEYWAYMEEKRARLEQNAPVSKEG